MECKLMVSVDNKTWIEYGVYHTARSAHLQATKLLFGAPEERASGYKFAKVVPK